MIELSPFTDPEADDLRGNYDATGGGAAGGDVDFSFVRGTYDDGPAEAGDWPSGVDMPACLVPIDAAAVDPMAGFESDMERFSSVVDRHRANAGGDGPLSQGVAAHNVADVGDDGTVEAPTAGGSGGGAKPPDAPPPPTGGESSGNEREGGEDDETQGSQTSSSQELTVTFDLGGRVLSSTLNGVDLAAVNAEPAVENPLGVVRDVGSTLPGDEKEVLLERRRLGRAQPEVTVLEDELERVLKTLRHDDITGQDDPTAKRYVYVPEVTPEDIAAAGGDPLLALARKAEQIDTENESDGSAS